MSIPSENKWQAISWYFDEERFSAETSLGIVGFSRGTGYASVGIDLFVLMG